MPLCVEALREDFGVGVWGKQAIEARSWEEILILLLWTSLGKVLNLYPQLFQSIAYLRMSLGVL